MDATQRMFALAVRDLMVRYPDVGTAEKAREKASEGRSPAPKKKGRKKTAREGE